MIKIGTFAIWSLSRSAYGTHMSYSDEVGGVRGPV